MSSNNASLDAAAQERKARLAKLRSLKRKQPDSDNGPDGEITSSTEQESSVTTIYLSGRNYDAVNRAPKLGFEVAPDEGKETLEKRAEEIEVLANKTAIEDQADEPIDLFKLQPKKPNWDLKRDLDKKLEKLNVQTDNAIARIVRERISSQKKKKAETEADGEGENVGMPGQELVESLREREREDVEDDRRENEEIEEM